MKRFWLAPIASLVLVCLAPAEDKEICPRCMNNKKHRCNTCDEVGSKVLDCLRCEKGKEDCPTCGAQGWLPCPNGDTLPCKKCHGDKKIGCPECDKGKRKCTECLGKGKVSMPCPACAGTGRQECATCIDWGVAVRKGGMEPTRDVVEALKTFEVAQGDLKILEGAFRKNLPGQTQYEMERTFTPQIGGYKDGICLYAIALLERPQEKGTDGMPMKEAGLMKVRNAKVLVQATNDMESMVEPVLKAKWTKDLKYVFFAVVAATDENGLSKWRPRICAVVKYQKLLEIKKPGDEESFDVMNMADWSFTDPAMKY
ncbi:MAG: hypothetical protein HYY18_07450 [Planctomycetes bacterium]|nr:hypothetical protein [Planctomycetota bacterium]